MTDDVTWPRKVKVVTQSRSHGSVRVVRTTSKVYGKCSTLNPKPPMNPLSDRHQIWRSWLRHEYLPSRKKWAQSVKGFLLPTWVKFGLSLYMANVRYATLRSRMFTIFLVLPITYGRDACMDSNALYVKRRGCAQGSAFWGLQKLNFIFNWILVKNRKN